MRARRRRRRGFGGRYALCGAPRLRRSSSGGTPCRSGRRTSGAFEARSVPPWAETSDCASASPMPKPCAARAAARPCCAVQACSPPASRPCGSVPCSRGPAPWPGSRAASRLGTFLLTSPIEAFEDVRQVFRRDARAGVGDADAAGERVLAHLHADGSSGGSVLHAVLQHVFERLGRPCGISGERRAFRGVDGADDIVQVQCGGKWRKRVVRHAGGVHVHLLHAECPGVHLRHLEQGGNQPAHTVRSCAPVRAACACVRRSSALFSMAGTMRLMAVRGVRIWCDTSASASASAPFSFSSRMVASRRVATILDSWFFRMARSPSR